MLLAVSVTARDSLSVLGIFHNLSKYLVHCLVKETLMINIRDIQKVSNFAMKARAVCLISSFCVSPKYKSSSATPT